MSMQITTQALRNDPALAEYGQNALQDVLTRATTDRAFRDLLIADPRGAVAEFSGKPVSEVPEFLATVAFVENTASATIVLPDAVDPEAELSESELEAVAGGVTPAAIAYLGAIAVGVAVGKCISKEFHN